MLFWTLTTKMELERPFQYCKNKVNVVVVVIAEDRFV